jgi:hypothetical protein
MKTSYTYSLSLLFTLFNVDMYTMQSLDEFSESGIDLASSDEFSGNSFESDEIDPDKSIEDESLE